MASHILVLSSLDRRMVLGRCLIRTCRSAAGQILVHNGPFRRQCQSLAATRPLAGNGSHKITLWEAICLLYSPLFNICCTCIFQTLKGMETFYRLTKAGGAEATDALFLDYTESTVLATFYTSLFKRHWPVLIGICYHAACQAMHSFCFRIILHIGYRKQLWCSR